jgi:plasmid stabilization system protein ParE
MTVRFLSIAEQEFKDAFDYYENIVEGLGDQFKQEIIVALKRIQDFPDAWQKLSRKTRRCRLDRFPYGLVYQNRANEILIIAVMELSRKPSYWIERVT